MKLCKIGIHINKVDVKTPQLDCYDQIEWEINRQSKAMFEAGIFLEILAGLQAELVHAKMYHPHSWGSMTVVDSVCLDCGKCWHNIRDEKQKIRLYVKEYIETANDSDSDQKLAKAILKDCNE